MSKLDNLLETIHPKKTIEQISLRANAAVNAFNLGPQKINDLDELQKLLTGFYDHVQRKVLQIRGTYKSKSEILWGPCRNILQMEYGTRWPVTIMEIIKSQIDGGLYGVLKKLAEGMIVQYTKSEITSKVANFWNNLTVDERLAIADEYLEKFGDFLPYDLKAGNAARLRMNMFNVLVNHPYMISGLRTLGRF